MTTYMQESLENLENDSDSKAEALFFINNNAVDVFSKYYRGFIVDYSKYLEELGS